MAIASNTFTRFDAIGVREDLSDVIYNIAPEETPFMSNGGRESVSNTFFEWQTDTLAAVSTANHQLEGDDLVTTGYDAVTATVRVGNYTSISRKTVIVTGTLEAVNKAGRKRELAYQLSKKSAELKRDMEAIALDNNAAVAGTTTTARETAGIVALLSTNTNFYTTDGADPTWASGAPTAGNGAGRTDGTVRAFSETILKDVVQQVYTAGGKASILMVGPVNKQRASGFAGIAAVRVNQTGRQAEPGVIIGAADVYVSDFGNLSVVPNRFMRERDALFLDPEYYSFAFLRPFRTYEMAKTGDAEKRMLLVEWGLKVHEEAAHGIAADLTTS